MPKHTIFVCKSCHNSSEERPEKSPFDGDTLLDKVNTLCSKKLPSDEITIQPVGCLWACSQGCVVAVSSDEKPTYLFVNLTPEESAAALLEFMQLYIKSRKGNIVWEKLPQVLQPAIFAQIPPVEA
ncbi:DUF1636 family protein [Nostoc sp. UHCC 0252]|uniref:DUF1636 family protein n=1 Tax=Nostoc sp. UHCC 0252 TaxID=3110241 RepID=UPI002B2086E7|nr:DUF1636 family protein [Nostoc sp. UHCC 0252]MEA5605579.1 DUF1636 family protein [Nostoc sp. UHCC 0252]